MPKRFIRLLLCCAMAVMSGCALVPPEPVVTGPLTAPPPMPPPPIAQANGAIFQPTAYGNYPLFEDRRPRNVGDIVTVVIQEKTNAAKNVQTTTDRSGSAGFGVGLAPAILPTDLGAKQNFDITGSNASEGKGRGSEHIRFSGVVDPRSITGSNTVSSTQVADARIEFRSKGTMDEVQTMGWLQRFFLNISPF